MSVQVERHHFNVDEYYRMGAAGIFSEDDRVELIEGEVIRMSPIGSRHAACVARLTRLFSRKSEDEAIVWIQNPIRLDEYSEPQPDLALLHPRDDFYAEDHPTPADVLLLVEVADTSIEYDRVIKVPLYARAGIMEVWLVDLTRDTVELYAQPLNGAYQISQQAARGESLTSSSIPALTLSAESILG
jgi:Uma2 family endonuclease